MQRVMYIEAAAALFEIVSLLNDESKTNTFTTAATAIFTIATDSLFCRGTMGKIEIYLLFCRQCTSRKVNKGKKISKIN